MACVKLELLRIVVVQAAQRLRLHGRVGRGSYVKQHLSPSALQPDISSMVIETVRNFTKHGLALPGDIQEAFRICDTERVFEPIPD